MGLSSIRGMSDLHTMINPSCSPHFLTDSATTQARNDEGKARVHLCTAIHSWEPRPATQLDILAIACYTAAIHSDGKTPCVAELCHCSPSQTAGAVWLRHIPERAHP